MKPLVTIVLLCLLVSFWSRKKDNSVEPTSAGATHYVLVEGVWQGTLEGRPFDVTFLESEFEGSPTVSGSAHVTEEARSTLYMVGSGAHNRRDSVWFALYPVPKVTGGSYILKGAVTGATIAGSYRQANENRGTIKSGTWEVRILP